ncbi:hypothetical protein I553_0192 [Mycobacterium xenopi 4042]|uniref:Uncharacterized protein n=1 Tax=Mycobacterium xenopi 4042 TaxID=1299334 RepID=X7YJT5_MYCXE|nr:hypothetical protein I553_0192 [Mycobacterium xenopi 4042]
MHSPSSRVQISAITCRQSAYMSGSVLPPEQEKSLTTTPPQLSDRRE